MKEDLENVILMGLGAMAMTNDKAKTLKEDLLKRGKEAYEQGKDLNEELKHNIADKIKENVTVTTIKADLSKEEMASKISKMSEEDKKEILNLLKKDTKKKNA
jgi:polyhydroxyalkanoate synthesis regulator phasin